MGLEVVSGDGSAIDLRIASARAIVRQSFWLLLFFLVEPSPLAIDVPAALFLALPFVAVVATGLGAVRSDGRSVHDLVADTVVIRTGEPERHNDTTVATHISTPSTTEDRT